MFSPSITMKTALLLTPLTLTILLAACTTAQPPAAAPTPPPEPKPEEITLSISEDNPYERIPVIDAYYEGQKIWFLHTDVADEGMSKKLTKMVNYATHNAPKLGEFDHEKAGTLYVFTNGVSQKDVKPWGGGPFNYQIDVFDSIPGDPNYTPIRHPHLVSWNDDAEPRILKSVSKIEEAIANGEITIKKPEGVLVNVPIVKWPGGQSRLP